jgi:PKD repeat protein
LYTVTLVASNANCSDTTTFEVIADNASLTELNGSNWLLYPNPANEGLNVEFTYGIAQSVSIVDAAGRVVLECPILSSLSYLNISGLARGTYRVVASFGDGTKSVKPFVKQD